MITYTPADLSREARDAARRDAKASGRRASSILWSIVLTERQNCHLLVEYMARGVDGTKTNHELRIAI